MQEWPPHHTTSASVSCGQPETDSPTSGSDPKLPNQANQGSRGPHALHLPQDLDLVNTPTPLPFSAQPGTGG